MGGGGIVVQPRSCSKLEAAAAARSCADKAMEAERKKQQKRDSNLCRWPVDALQVMEAQLGLLRSHSDESCEFGGDDDVGRSPKRTKRDEEAAQRNKKLSCFDSSPQDGGGCGGGSGKGGRVIDLQTQPPLPYGWEQFLDLNTGEVYYIDWSSCKRTCRDPREVFRIADNKIRAIREQVYHHLLLSSSSFRQDSCSLDAVESSDSWKQQQQRRLFDDSAESESTSCSAGNELESSGESDGAAASMDSTLCSSQKKKGGYSACVSSSSSADSKHHDEDEDENVMVAVGCHRCLTYYLLPRLDPSCPSCGAHLQVKNS